LFLEHLRRPYPHDFKTEHLLLLQARCWDALDFPEVSILFYQEVAKALPPAMAAVMDCYRRMDRIQEAAEIAWQLLRDPQALPLDTCLAASTLFILAPRLQPGNPGAVFEAIVGPLRRVFEELNRRPSLYRQDVQPLAARALAFTLLQLNRHDEVREVCERTLVLSPSDPSLLLARGLANLRDNPSAAEADFRGAVIAGTPVALPYAVLAWFSVTRREYEDVLSLSSQAISSPDLPTDIRGLMFELHGIAQAQLKQDKARIEEDFARALSLNPTKSGRIEHNRRVAIKALESSTVPRAEQWTLPDRDTAILQLRGAVLGTLSSAPFRDYPGEAISDFVAILE
jgi:hypothetical protein